MDDDKSKAFAEARMNELSRLRELLRKDWHERNARQQLLRAGFEICYGSLTVEDIAFIRETE